MRIAIDHETQYRYDLPASYGVQEVRLTPLDNACQKIVDWAIDMPGFDGAVQYYDADRNSAHLVNQMQSRDSLSIRVRGTVETRDNGGVTGVVDSGFGDRIYTRQTGLTLPGAQTRRLAAHFEGDTADQLALCHALMDALREKMDFITGTTDSETSGEESLREGSGVCQDFSHVFISVCRLLDMPARYVTGYLAIVDEEATEFDAHHAWAEASIPGLGWVGFDAANGISPDARYVRLACGLDAAYAAPVRGIRRGAGNESLSVKVYAAEQPQQ